MFTPAQAAAYDAWKTAGPPEDPCEDAFERIEDMDLAELAAELEDLIHADDELPSRQASCVDAVRFEVFTRIGKELTRLEDSPEVWDEDGEPVDPNDPIHAIIANANELVGKTLKYHPSYHFR